VLQSFHLFLSTHFPTPRFDFAATQLPHSMLPVLWSFQRPHFVAVAVVVVAAVVVAVVVAVVAVEIPWFELAGNIDWFRCVPRSMSLAVCPLLHTRKNKRKQQRCQNTETKERNSRKHPRNSG
jgi:hypothetical protein